MLPNTQDVPTAIEFLKGSTSLTNVIFVEHEIFYFSNFCVNDSYITFFFLVTLGPE